jgi:hypothetical protein
MTILQDVAHDYDCKWYTWYVLSIEETDTVNKMFLYPNRPSLSYMYPTRLNILQVPRKDILMKVDYCSARGRTHTLRVEKNDKMNNKHVFFHK